MINITNPQQCCGCTACASVCTKNAITMEPDALGFLYPKVNTDLCIDCGACEKVCAFNENYDKSLLFDQPLAFGARHIDNREVETSRSGAAFIALSDYILNQGGVVYGAGYTDHFRVVHKRAETKEQRDEFKGSKYVQSDLTGIFRQVKLDLKSGLFVLFSGTPCQCAGLTSYIGKRLRDKLYLVDIVCHGVPSPYIWRDYLDYQEKKNGIEFTEVNFRDKSKIGWVAHKESFRGDNFYKLTSHYTFLFYKHIMFRHSCEVCPYTNLKRTGDVTIADFWGYQKTNPEVNIDNKGYSLVFCNTSKGKDWLDKVRSDLNVIPADLENCMQPNLKGPSSISEHRFSFEKDYAKKGFLYVGQKYGDLGWKYSLIYMAQNIKNIIKFLLLKK